MFEPFFCVLGWASIKKSRLTAQAVDNLLSGWWNSFMRSIIPVQPYEGCSSGWLCVFDRMKNAHWDDYRFTSQWTCGIEANILKYLNEQLTLRQICVFVSMKQSCYPFRSSSFRLSASSRASITSSRSRRRWRWIRLSSFSKRSMFSKVNALYES